MLCLGFFTAALDTPMCSAVAVHVYALVCLLLPPPHSFVYSFLLLFGHNSTLSISARPSLCSHHLSSFRSPSIALIYLVVLVRRLPLFVYFPVVAASVLFVTLHLFFRSGKSGGCVHLMPMFHVHCFTICFEVGVWLLLFRC